MLDPAFRYMIEVPVRFVNQEASPRLQHPVHLAKNGLGRGPVVSRLHRGSTLKVLVWGVNSSGIHLSKAHTCAALGMHTGLRNHGRADVDP
jgi:hypothetical protein